MKQLYILALAILPCFSFAQDSIKLPIQVAKSVVKDLVNYEGVKKQLQLCDEQVRLLDRMVVVKDRIITTYAQKEETYKQQIQNEKDKIELHKQAYEELKTEKKKIKRRLIANQIGSGVVIGFLAYLLIIK